MKTIIDKSEILQRALGMALEAHAGRTRAKHTSALALPYVVHPIEVMKTLWDWGVRDIDVLVAALLHDCVEDTLLDPLKIEDQFGPRVRLTVEELTFLPAPNWDTEMRAKRKAEYIADFRNRSLGALLIKVADRFCNLWDFMRNDPSYAAVYFHKADAIVKFCAMRSSEIVECFGEIVYASLFEAQRRLELVLRNEKEASTPIS